jgi:transaldolase
VSLFGGRIDDEGGDATYTIRSTREWLDLWEDDCPNTPEIIVGSSRTRGNIADWAATGAHVLTVTPAILGQMVTNARTKETVTQFLTDADQALSNME